MAPPCQTKCKEVAPLSARLAKTESRNFFFSSRRRHTRWNCDWSSDVCSSDLDVNASGKGPQCEHRQCRKRAGIEIGRASCRESVDLGGRRIIKKKKKKNTKEIKIQETTNKKETNNETQGMI